MKKLSRMALVMFFILLLSKILGFLREILLAYKYGTSYINDAYTICTSLPAVLFALFASGFTQSYIPAYTRSENSKKQDFFSNIITVLFCASIIIACICVIFDRQIMYFLAPGFDKQTQDLAELFIDIVVWYLPIYVIFNILSANAQIKESFLVTSCCDYIIVNIIIIISVIISNKEHLEILAGGYVVAMLVATLILVIYSKRRLNLKYKFIFEPFNENVQNIMRLALPIGISVMVNQLNTVTDRMFASMLGVGVTSALEYANRVQSLFLTLTTTVFISVCFPRVNKFFAKRELEKGIYYIKNAILLTAFFSIPFMVMLIGYSEIIVKILFERGAFDSQSTKMTAECLMFYAIGIPFYAFREVGTKTLAADLKQGYILKNTVIAVVVNIILDALLFRILGHIGLAVATSIAGIVCSILMANDLRYLKIMRRKEIIEILKIIFITTISYLLSSFIYNILNSNISYFWAFLVSIVLFCVIYSVLCILMKIKIMIWCINTLIIKQGEKKL